MVWQSRICSRQCSIYARRRNSWKAVLKDRPRRVQRPLIVILSNDARLSRIRFWPSGVWRTFSLCFGALLLLHLSSYLLYSLYDSEESERVSELKSISGSSRLPYGTLALGAEGIKNAIKTFDDAYALHPILFFSVHTNSLL